MSLNNKSVEKMESKKNVLIRTVCLKYATYFTTVLSLAVLWTLAQLPLKALLKFSGWLGTLSYFTMKRRTAIARQNIRACFPELTNSQQEAITKACIIENIRGVFESAKAWWGNMQPILDEAEVHGLDILKEATHEQKGCLLVGAHFTTLDMGGRVLAELWPVDILYRPFNNPVYDQAVFKARAKIYNRTIDKKRMRDLVRSLQSGHTLWYPADQDYGAKDSVFASFFNINAASLATTAGLAKRCHGHVVGLFHHRTHDNRYRIEFKRMDNFPTHDPIAAATQANATIEAGIRLAPAQYMWVHRRFKTRPNYEPDFYNL